MTGRPLELNDSVAETICSQIEAGLPIGLAAATAGFTRQAVDKWQRQGRVDLEAGAVVTLDDLGRPVGGTPQARLVVRLERARAKLATSLVDRVRAGATGKPFEVDWRAAVAALETLMPAHFGKRALELQAAREEQADAPADTTTSPTQGSVVEAVRCVTCGVGTASDDPGRPPLFCAGCGAKLPAASTAK